MHEANMVFWRRVRSRYSALFSPSSSVLEVGSYDINGSIRCLFDGAAEYVGVDWRQGPGVDVVCAAEAMSFDRTFDAVVSASMLEHDDNWCGSLAKMASFVKPGGGLFLSWGAAGNPPHCHGDSRDGRFHPLPAGRVVSFLGVVGMTVVEFWYEINLPGVSVSMCVRAKSPGTGEVCLVAMKPPLPDGLEFYFDPFLPGDAVFDFAR